MEAARQRVLPWIASLLLCSLLAASSVQAQAPLEGLAAALRGDDAAEREAAIEALRSLPESEHDAITARIGALVRRATDATTSDELLTSMRRATGSRRADDVVDVADGVATVLAARHDEVACRTAELILLARSLESHETPAALLAAVESFRMPGNGWEMESRRFTLRLMERVAGPALRALGHGDVHVREWARWTVHRLGIDAPGTFVRTLSPSILADVLEAYGQARLMVAMPVVGSFVDAPQRAVREGAFAGLSAYGRNAVWVVREAYQLHTSEDANLEWGPERTLDALRTVIDEQRLEHARAALTEAQAALDAGDDERAVLLADQVLVTRPELASADIARIYLSVAEHVLAARDAARARVLLGRAERVARGAGDAALASRAAGLAAYVHAEEALAAGVLDADAYAAAAAAVPDHEALQALANRYAEPTASVADRSMPLGIAALLFLMISLLLATWRAPQPKVTQQPSQLAEASGGEASDEQATPDSPLLTMSAIHEDEAPATLPG